MDETRQKDPERQRLGRLGALTLHARGRTNVAPARAAWEQGLAAEFGIEVDAPDRERRLEAAMRVRMTRLAMSRWAKREAPAPAKANASEDRDGPSTPHRPAA
jgi:hypothetical protein